EMTFEVPVGTAGDTYDRYLVRMEEFRQSLRIIRQAAEGIPEGPIVGKVPRLIKPAAGETYHAIESPKGELGYFIVSDGKSTNPYRFRVRPPSFCNLQGLRTLIKGHLIADVVALLGSLDVVLGEVARAWSTRSSFRASRSRSCSTRRSSRSPTWCCSSRRSSPGRSRGSGRCASGRTAVCRRWATPSQRI